MCRSQVRVWVSKNLAGTEMSIKIATYAGMRPSIGIILNTGMRIGTIGPYPNPTH